jgi:methylase of polypeptide subunit release factors
MSEALVRADQANFLHQLKQLNEPYQVLVEGTAITVMPEVFPPTTDTRLFAKHIHVKPGDKILDLTCVSGIFAAVAGIQVGSGVANDLNPAAAMNAYMNISKYGIDFIVTEGSLFDSVPEG